MYLCFNVCYVAKWTYIFYVVFLRFLKYMKNLWLDLNFSPLVSSWNPYQLTLNIIFFPYVIDAFRLCFINYFGGFFSNFLMQNNHGIEVCHLSTKEKSGKIEWIFRKIEMEFNGLMNEVWLLNGRKKGISFRAILCWNIEEKGGRGNSL